MTTINLANATFDEVFQTFSDIYKEETGFRPRGEWVTALTREDLENEISVMLEERWDRMLFEQYQVEEEDRRLDAIERAEQQAEEVEDAFIRSVNRKGDARLAARARAARN